MERRKQQTKEEPNWEEMIEMVEDSENPEIKI
jgi:hypothetical protein